MGNQYKIGLSQDNTYLYARAIKTHYTLEMAQLLAGELISFGEDLDILGCLIDFRESISISSVVDKYKFAFEKAKELGLPRHWKYAFLVDKGDVSPDFIDTVMRNAGYMFQLFETENEAITWIKDTQSSQDADAGLA